MNEINTREFLEVSEQKYGEEGYKDIKAEGDITVEESHKFWDNFLKFERYNDHSDNVRMRDSNKENLEEGLLDSPHKLEDLEIIKSPIKNKIEGMRREREIENELKEKYPEFEGYKIESEVYLRDGKGEIAKDPETREARRVDFVVTKDGKAIDSIEVTSETADKREQSAKEDRIRENGGNYIKDSQGNLIRILDSIRTRIERRN